jgi:hypothetical protein
MAIIHKILTLKTVSEKKGSHPLKLSGPKELSEQSINLSRL